MAKPKASETDDRTRNWTFILYPESAPVNWRSVLDDLCIPWVESPCHQFDVDEATGELKKAHYHVMLLFRGKKSFEQISSIAKSLNGSLVKRVQDTIGLTRYFAHLDHPHKYQYDPKDIVPHGGVDLDKLLVRSTAERHQTLRDILSYAKEKNISEYCDLVDQILSDEDHAEWFDLITESYTIFLSSYFRSKSFKSSHFSSGCCE